MAWGAAGSGGDGRAVQHQLPNMPQLAASADLGDGSVVTWGNAGSGADSSAVQDQSKNVHVVHGFDDAFEAVLKDGRVVTWRLVVTVVLSNSN